jgi:hypothetical protein
LSSPGNEMYASLTPPLFNRVLRTVAGPMARSAPLAWLLLINRRGARAPRRTRYSRPTTSERDNPVSFPGASSFLGIPACFPSPLSTLQAIAMLCVDA